MDVLFPDSARITVPEWMVLRGGSRRAIPVAVRYGVFVHPVLGLTLIDTGYGPEVTERPGRSFLMRAYARILGIQLRQEGAPATVLQRLGYRPRDVQTVVLSHYHADHIGRLREFPGARLIAPGAAFADLRGRGRLGQLHHGFFRELLPDDIEARMTPIETFPRLSHPIFGETFDLGGDQGFLAVDLPGHALGHVGFLFAERPRPLLYAVDVQWQWDALKDGRFPGLPASAVYSDRGAMAPSCARVRAFAEKGGAVVLCHDPADNPHGL